MANFEKKTIKQIYDGIIAKYTALRSKYGDSAPLLEKAAIRSLAFAYAGVAGTLWELATWIYKQCFPQTCGKSTLEMWGNLVGVNFNEGETANLIVRITGATAESLSAGTLYKNTTTGLTFKTVSKAVFIDGAADVMVSCLKSGPDGNLPPGEILNISSPLEGVPSTALVKNIALEGSNDEDVEIYRKRVLMRYKNQSQGGTALDYYNWAMQVPGIVDALPYTLREGVVSIYLVGEGSGTNRNVGGTLTPNPFPIWTDGVFQELTGSGLIYQVAESIEGDEPGLHNRRPMCASVNLLQPNYTSFSVEIVGLTSTNFNEEIKNALINSFDSKRPHIKVLGYKESNAKINKHALSSIVFEIIGTETFTDFILKDSNGQTVNETTLGVGSLACMSKLTINGTNISL